MTEERPLIVLVTAGSAENAEAIARALVEERLAACVNVVASIRSVYRWQDRIHDDAEWLLVIKSERTRFATLEARVRELHTYDVPEVVALDVTEASASYLEWWLAQLRGR